MNENFNSAFYKKILDQINSNIYVTDVETDEIVYMNDYMKNTFQVSNTEGKKCWQILQSGMNKRCEFCKIKQLQESNSQKICVWYEKNTITEKTYLNHDTLELWDNKLYHIQNSIDVTEQLQLSVEATIDELTGIFNRNAGKKRIEELLTAEYLNEDFVVVLYDMNGLKWVNDTYGHLEGDRLLIFVAQNIKKRLKEPNFIFRLSGDEFIIVFLDTTVKGVEVWMDNILLTLNQERIKENIDSDTSFSYGIANIHVDENLTVSDVLSIADSQMYIQKRDYHILMNKKRLTNSQPKYNSIPLFEYNRDHLFESLSETIDDYLFVGNLKTSKFMYSRQMMIDFRLPNQILDNAAAFWGEKIHPDDKAGFLRSNQEIADGRAEQHTIYYRAKDASNRWIPLLCKGKMIRDKNGNPDLFAGTIRNLDKNREQASLEPNSLDTYLDTSYYIYEKNQSNKNNFLFQKSFYFVNIFDQQNDLKTKTDLLDFVNKNIPGGILAVQAHSGFPLYCFNQAILEYTQYSYEELCQITNGKFSNIIYEKDRQFVEREIFQQLERNDIYEIRYRIVCHGGHLLWVYERGKYVIDEHGQKLILSFFVDISHEMNNEQELRFINENSLDGVFKAALIEHFPILYANDGYYRIHGYTKKQFHHDLNDCAENLIYESDKARIRAQITDLIKNNQSQAILEYRIKKRDNSIAWIHISASFTSLLDQTIIMIGMVMDITKRKKLEDKLYRSQQLFKVAQTKTGLNIWEFDIQNKQVIGNPDSAVIRSYQNLTANIPESIIAQGLIHPQSINELKNLYQHLEKGAAPLSATIRVKQKDAKDKYLWEKITYTIVQHIDEKPAWAIGISEDVTEQKEIETRIYKEESLRKVLNEDIILNIRLNFSRDFIEDISLHSNEQYEKQLSDYTYDDIYKYLLQTIANEDDQKKFEKKYSKNQINDYIRTFTDIPTFEFRQKYLNGMILWVSLNMKTTISPQNNDVILFIYTKNIDIQKRRELALQNKAEIDEMSSLYNESTSQLMIETLLKKEYDPKKVNAFLLLDIDNFKQINHSGNFLFGDQIIRQMGQMIKKSISSSCIAARINGDTFSIFYHNAESKKVIYQAALQLQKKLSSIYHFQDIETQLTLTGGLIYLFSENMSYSQIHQCALHALDTAKRRGKNQILSYQEIEKVEFNFKIEMIINPNDFTILSMSPTGQIIFNCIFPVKKPIKCYELLHNRKSPCPFCSQQIDFEQTNMRECFVSKIDKLMYVKEQLSHYEGDTVRKIEMQDIPFNLAYENQDSDLQQFLEISWKNIDKNIQRENAFDNILRQLGTFFNAQNVLLFHQSDNQQKFSLTSKWNYNNQISNIKNTHFSKEHFENIVSAVAPQKYFVILDKNHFCYKNITELYFEKDVPLPLLFIGIYNKNKLVSCLLVETVKQHINASKSIEVIADVICKITTIYNLQTKYTYALTHDQKTGLSNYDSYIKTIRNINTDIYSTFGMIEITIINLKKYNQRYGIVQGDEILQFIAQTITKFFDKKSCYRISNAHFIVLCPDITYENFIHIYDTFYQELIEFYDQWIICEKVWEKNSLVLETMQEQLEEKTRHAVNKKIHSKLAKSDQSIAKILERLNTAFVNGKFLTFLQPKAHTKTNQICGAEALIRYNDPQKGIIPPGRFLPEIERAGLIRHIDLFILKDVCRILSNWLKTTWKPFPISINYSRATILEPGILEETNKIVESYNIPKELIEIEVTESIGSIDSASLKNIVNQFLAEGYKIALDDFGAEYSNIYILYSLHLSSLKLDRKIVSDIYHDHRAKLVIKNIINTCQQLDITCVAEGVETKEQLKVLKDLSCDVIQGYYLNKPLSEDDFKKISGITNPH